MQACLSSWLLRVSARVPLRLLSSWLACHGVSRTASVSSSESVNQYQLASQAVSQFVCS